MGESVLVNSKIDHGKQCYLCRGMEFGKRAGSVRDNPEFKVLECGSCGLVFLSSFDHIRDGFMKASPKMNGNILERQFRGIGPSGITSSRKI